MLSTVGATAGAVVTAGVAGAGRAAGSRQTAIILQGQGPGQFAGEGW